MHDVRFNADLSGWDVSSVMDMRYMFDGASAFNADMSGWDVSSATDMYSMFYASDGVQRRHLGMGRELRDEHAVHV